jgi:hypothetical protein
LFSTSDTIITMNEGEMGGMGEERPIVRCNIDGTVRLKRILHMTRVCVCVRDLSSSGYLPVPGFLIL